MRRFNRISACICIAYLTLILTEPLVCADIILDAVNKVSLEQYRTYQVDIENMGLGFYGGQAYNQGFRNRDGWADGGTLGNQETRLYLVDHLSSMGLDVSIQGSYANVVAELPGIQTPGAIYIVCGHYDTTSNDERPGGDLFIGHMLAFGGGIDLDVKDYLAIRVIQFDYIPHTIESDFTALPPRWAHDFRISFGIILKDR